MKKMLIAVVATLSMIVPALMFAPSADAREVERSGVVTEADDDAPTITYYTLICWTSGPFVSCEWTPLTCEQAGLPQDNTTVDSGGEISCWSVTVLF